MKTAAKNRTHCLKSWPAFFSLTLSGLKPFEIRRNDRDFSVGDAILLKEWDRVKGYTGEVACFQVSYILLKAPGLKKNHCILGLFGPWGII